LHKSRGFFLVMSLETTLIVIDHLGVFFFAVSGLLAATERNLDVFGGFIIAFITALGGGTVRDLLLNTDIAWLFSYTHIITVLSASILGIIFSKQMRKLRKTFFIFDTLGISLFTILGVQKALDYNHLAITSVFLGMISATFGGVIRDVLCNEIPLIFRKEIYAIPCLTGAVVYICGLYILEVDSLLLFIISICIIAVFRTFAVYYGWRVPLLKELEK
jgi:uncharacterized membrane protein YeiH